MAQHQCEYHSVRYPQIQDEENLPMICIECIHCKAGLPRWRDILEDADVFQKHSKWTPMQLARYLHLWITEVDKTDRSHGLTDAWMWENYYIDNKLALNKNAVFIHKVLADFRNTNKLKTHIVLTESDLKIVLTYLHTKLPNNLGHPNALIYIANSLIHQCDFFPSIVSLTNNEDLIKPFWKELNFNACHVMHLSNYVYENIVKKVKQRQGVNYQYADFRLMYVPVLASVQLLITTTIQSLINFPAELTNLVLEYTRCKIPLQMLQNYCENIKHRDDKKRKRNEQSVL
jgi:hypothetical protein